MFHCQSLRLLQLWIIFMSMINDIVWDAKGNDDTCENNSKTLQHYVRRFLRGHWSFVGHGSEKKWYGTYGSRHPVFHCTSALERGELRSKASGKKSVLFNGSTQNIELLLQIVISPSVNSVFTSSTGIWLNNCQLVRDFRGKPLHKVNWTNKKFLHNFLVLKCKPMKSDREICCEITSNDLKKWPEDQKLFRLSSEAGLRLVEVGQFF